MYFPRRSQVSFAKEPDKRDYILQKRPVLSAPLWVIHGESCVYYVSLRWRRIIRVWDSCVYHVIYTRLPIYFPRRLQVSFAQVPSKRDYILQKRPTILRSLLIESCVYYVLHIRRLHCDFRSLLQKSPILCASLWVIHGESCV